MVLRVVQQQDHMHTRLRHMLREGEGMQRCQERSLSFIAYCEQYAEYDMFLTPPEYPNPWIHETTELWEMEKQCKDPLPLRRVRRWAFGLRELLCDPAGQEHFARFLSKEFSGENLKFWLAVQDLKAQPIRRVASRAKEIWKEFLASDAPSPVNIDAASRELTRVKVEAGTADRYCFDQAQAHVYHLMKSDSYSRYLRSEMYKDYLNGSKKKMRCQPRDLRWDTSSASNFIGCLTLHAETQQCKHCCFTAGLASKMVVAIRADLAQGPTTCIGPIVPYWFLEVMATFAPETTQSGGQAIKILLYLIFPQTSVKGIRSIVSFTARKETTNN
ncbi:hypothetical protein MSG28_015987 [Choristoneura fumiferana]|uniref:Uncharacterized protein n=1 Tax=Choristoneura fumiferana TaxID=7141 RepID=A0ACC0K5E5_CHOFU|nr:hypothetical protein MSG28_015987 [Choristoneura fumiferana]